MAIPDRILAKPQSLKAWTRTFERTEVFGLLLLAPAILTMVVVVLYPIVSAINLSFHRIDIFTLSTPLGPMTFVNYVRLIQSPTFWHSVGVSVSYVVISTFFGLLIGFATALLLNQRFRGRVVARTLTILPWAVPPVVAVNIWWWILDPSYGLLNWVLLRSGVIGQPINWISSPRPALVAVILVTVWKGYPFFVVMILAGLQAIPQDFYDAVSVDGGGRVAAFRYVTVPGLQHVLALATLLNVLWVFREFTFIWVLTGGGPIHATETLAIRTYQEAFQFFHMGLAAAIGVITLVISIVASIAFIRQAAKEFY